MRREVPRNIPPVVGSNQGPATTCRQTDPLDFGLKLPSDPMRVPAPKGGPVRVEPPCPRVRKLRRPTQGPRLFQASHGSKPEPTVSTLWTWADCDEHGTPRRSCCPTGISAARRRA